MNQNTDDIKNIVKLIDLCKTYKSGDTNINVLRNVNLEINKDDFIAILGTSGCGKTTLLNILGFMDNLSSGTYIFNGTDSKQLSRSKMANIRNKSIGFVFQSYNLIHNMTAIENVEIPMGYRGAKAKDRKERAYHLLEKVGLADRYDHIPTELSGGEQQRVAIARALANEPLLILADEPTGNLDMANSENIMEIFKNLKEKYQKCIIVVTHSDTIASYADCVINISNGKII